MDRPRDYCAGWSNSEGGKTNTIYHPHILAWSPLSHPGLGPWYVWIRSRPGITASKGPDASLIPMGPFLWTLEVGNGKATSVLASHGQDSLGPKEGSPPRSLGFVIPPSPSHSRTWPGEPYYHFILLCFYGDVYFVKQNIVLISLLFQSELIPMIQSPLLVTQSSMLIFPIYWYTLFLKVTTFLKF